jgi:ribosomal protein S18 acetylase RimI-like enzyme
VYPAGPAADFATQSFPPPERMADRTLFIHCMMTGSPQQSDNPYQRRGLASRMVRTLMAWAARRGWTAVESHAYADLPCLYAVTGQAGRAFWEKLGFRVVSAVPEPAFAQAEHEPFIEALLKEAAQHGIAPEAATTRYTMRREMDKMD